MRWQATAATLLLLAGCAQGITPPTATETVLIEDVNGMVEYLFGGVPPCQLLDQGQFSEAPFTCAGGCPCTSCKLCCKPCADPGACPKITGCADGEEKDLDKCPGSEECPPGNRCDTRSACLQRDNLSPPMLVQIPAFRIDRHEVTNLQYRFCVEMGVCRKQPFDTLGQAIVADYAGDDAYNDFPALVLSAQDAKTYCEFVGKRLPTEFEWERVAGGATLVDAATHQHDLSKKRTYPFLAPDEPITACKSKDIALKPCSGAFQTAPVGTSKDDVVEEPPGSGRFIYDLGGNMTEWTSTNLTTDIITCKPGETFIGCEGQAAEACGACVDPTQTDQAACLPDGLGETACWFPVPATSSAGSNGCYSICAGQLGSTAVCEPRWRPDQDALSPATDLANVSTTPGSLVVRGGSYGLASKDICTARSGARGSESIEGLETHPWIGVRCACDAGKCP